MVISLVENLMETGVPLPQYALSALLFMVREARTRELRNSCRGSGGGGTIAQVPAGIRVFARYGPSHIKLSVICDLYSIGQIAAQTSKSQKAVCVRGMDPARDTELITTLVTDVPLSHAGTFSTEGWCCAVGC